jgi:glutathione synthase/RimK-type ligase-like ATP-grasp enzyme
MKIGFLDYKDDAFSQDAKKKLDAFGYKTEFLELKQQKLPIEKRFDVIVDRAGFHYDFLHETMKATAMRGTYIINNPFAYTEANKIMDSMLCHELGILVPKTFFLPQIDEEWEANDPIQLPDWQEIEKEITFPAIMKSFNGYAWENVFEVSNMQQAQKKFDELKKTNAMLLQEKIEFTDYYRVFCINKKDLLIAKWQPAPNGRGKLLFVEPTQAESVRKKIEKQTIKLNERLDFDVNAVEWCIDKKGKPIVIDAFNEVPDFDKQSMPEQYYWWAVDRMVDCIKDKAEKQKRNRTFF